MPPTSISGLSSSLHMVTDVTLGKWPSSRSCAASAMRIDVRLGNARARSTQATCRGKAPSWATSSDVTPSKRDGASAAVVPETLWTTSSFRAGLAASRRSTVVQKSGKNGVKLTIAVSRPGCRNG
jgi:hypothetical protein